MGIATRLFDEIRERTADRGGVSREPYSPAEQRAIDTLTDVANSLQLETRIDPFGNAYFILPGADRSAPGWIIGSHVDSVECGGNFDGLAGVVAGMTTIAAFRKAGIVPAADVTVMGVRAEELSSWYGGHHDGHIGSRAALGLLPRAELESAVSNRTGRTLASHMQEAGFQPDAVGAGRPYLDPARYKHYLELHIEQGPVLEGRGFPVGVVTAIRGATRARSCRCIGEYTHAGAVPRDYRRDAVKATVELIHALERDWEATLAAGKDLVFTVGRLFTDSALHALTKVPGETGFALDFRSQDEQTLHEYAARTQSLAAELATRYRVQFDLGQFSLHRPARMADDIQASMRDLCRTLGIPATDIPSGAGHDAQDFVHAGFTAGMIFVRNAHGSHNSREAMDMADFEMGTRVMAGLVGRG